MRHPRHRLLLLALLALACGRQAPPADLTPLVDGLHAPLVLTESALLDKPPADSANRFLAGWWPGNYAASPSQVNVGDRAVMEAVFLDGRERRLATRMELIQAEPGATFGVRIGALELPPQPLVRDAEIPLPGRLPLGRLPIRLDLRGARVEIQAAGFGHAWRAGEVELATEALVQGGYSAIDFPRRFSAPAELSGRFEPPPEAQPDQRFAVILETDAGGSEVAFEWRPGGWRDIFGPPRLRLDLPDGFVRIRLLAQGLGPAARWRDLGVTGGGPPPAEPVRLETIEGRAGPAYVAASERYKLVWAPDLGLAGDETTSRDAEFVFDLRRDPGERQNLAGIQAIEVDWLRARLAAWLERGGSR